MTFKEELEKIRAQIHFKENSIPSIHAGQLTDETITSIINLVDKELPTKERPNSIRGERFILGYNKAISDMRAKLREEKTS